jgi:hypothetical protein
MKALAKWNLDVDGAKARVALYSTPTHLVAVASFAGAYGDAVLRVRLDLDELRRDVMRAFKTYPGLRAELSRMHRELLRGDVVVAQVGAIGAKLTRKERKARRKRMARRFRNTIRKAARAVAKLKIFDRLRGVMRTILRSKIATRALTAAGAAFGGPLGAGAVKMLTSGLAAAELGTEGKRRSVDSMSLYEMGCKCGGGA